MPIQALQVLEKKIERQIRLFELKNGIRIDDEMRFIRSWIEKPLSIGAVTPSGKMLARTMARYIDPNAKGPVIELGPGTGPVTEALIAQGVDPSRLVLVEFDPDFCRMLHLRFPQATVVRGDAYALRHTLAGILQEPAAAMVSGLPLMTKRLPPDAPERAVRAVHLRGNPADSQGALRRHRRRLRADLDERAAGAGVGLSQGRLRQAGIRPPGSCQGRGLIARPEPRLAAAAIFRPVFSSYFRRRLA
jgi:phospholipid N-methyltransferase